MTMLRADRRALIAMSLCLLLGLACSFLFYLGLGAFKADEILGLFGNVEASILFVCTALTMAFFVFVFYSVFALGWLRIRDRRGELEQFDDSNTVGDPESGERKLHDYLTAITSMEARIGLLQRSAPYVLPEKRPPPEMKPPRHRLTPRGRNLVGTALCLGALSGIALGMLNGIDTRDLPDATLGYQPVVLVRLAICAALGLVGALPIAVLVAAFNVEVQEPRDAGADRPEAA
jgi:hypothetical protein